MRGILSPVQRIVVTVAGLVLAAGCFGHWVDFRVREISGLRARDIDDRGFGLTVRSRLLNPNRVGAVISDIRYRISTGNHPLGRGRIAGPIQVPARSPFDLDASLRVDYADLPGDFPRRVASGRLPLTVQTSLVAETRLGTFSMNLRSTGRVEIAEALEVAVTGSFRGRAVKVRRIRLASLSARAVELRLEVALHNAFAFPLRIERGEVELFVNGRYFGRSGIDSAVELPAGRTVIREFDVSAAHFRTWLAAGALLAGAPRFRARGVLWIEPIGGVSRIPFDLNADASVFAR